MIKINEEYSLDSDRYQWILIKGNAKTYYGNLSQVVRRLLNDSAKGCSNLIEVADRVEQMSQVLGKQLKPITEEK